LKKIVQGTLAAALLSLVACSGSASDGSSVVGQDTKAPSQSAEPFEQVSLGAVTDITALPLFVASQQGFFADNGLDVKFTTFGSGSDMNKALAAGTVQFATGGATSVPSSRSAGLLTKLIGGTVNDATKNEYDASLGIVGRKDAGIVEGDAASLKGKRVAVLSGSTTDFYFNSWMKLNGLTAKDLEIVSIAVTDHPVSLKQGSVDAVVSWEPYVSQEIRELGANAAVVARGEPVNVAFIIGMAATDETIAKSSRTLLKITAAVTHANQWVRQNPEKAAAVATGYITGLDSSDALAAIKQVSFDPRISACTKQAMSATAEQMVVLGKIKTAPPVTDLVDSQFVDQVEKDYPEWFSDLPALPANCK